MMNSHNPKLFALMLILGASNLASENLLNGFLIEKDAACEEQCGPSEKQSTISFYVWEGDTSGDWLSTFSAVFMDPGETKQIRAWFRVEGGSDDYGPTWTVTNPSDQVISNMSWTVGPGDRAHFKVTGQASPSGVHSGWHSNSPESKYAKTYSIVKAEPPDTEVPSSAKRLVLGVRQSFSVVVGSRHKTLLRFGDSSATINNVHTASWDKEKKGYFHRNPSSWIYRAVPIDPYWRNRLSISSQSPLAGEPAYLPVSEVAPTDGKGRPGQGTHRVRLEIEAIRTSDGLSTKAQYDIWVNVP